MRFVAHRDSVRCSPDTNPSPVWAKLRGIRRHCRFVAHRDSVRCSPDTNPSPVWAKLRGIRRHCRFVSVRTATPNGWRDSRIGPWFSGGLTGGCARRWSVRTATPNGWRDSRIGPWFSGGLTGGCARRWSVVAGTAAWPTHRRAWMTHGQPHPACCDDLIMCRSRHRCLANSQKGLDDPWATTPGVLRRSHHVP